MAICVELDVDRGLEVPRDALIRVVSAALNADEYMHTKLTIRITGDELLQKLNREHRDIDEPTDVLSFPMIDDVGFTDDFPGDEDTGRYLGDVVISLPAARRNAELTNTPLDRELSHLVTHGTLHLLGYSHDSETNTAQMRDYEAELLGDWVHAIWNAPPTH